MGVRAALGTYTLGMSHAMSYNVNPGNEEEAGYLIDSAVIIERQSLLWNSLL
jgi:hypothetical protein